MKRRELPGLHDRNAEVQEPTNRMPSRRVRWGLDIIGGLLVAFLVASCFIHCPKYLWVESRMERVYDDSLGVRLTGVAFIKEHDMWKLEVGMPILYRYIQGEFKAYIADLTPKYDPLMRMKNVEICFEPDEKVHPMFINTYGVLGRVRLENPTLFEKLFLHTDKK